MPQPSKAAIDLLSRMQVITTELQELTQKKRDVLRRFGSTSDRAEQTEALDALRAMQEASDRLLLEHSALMDGLLRELGISAEDAAEILAQRAARRRSE
ncbi:MAG: hypothetical protein F9K40_19320 [Kofleriaceae bacterium]|nr:MAG: hypothetical protein F9K40_19320 [Kofleriaceae bacterium]MBZ0231529.1 hypothetical protein [Kofleriaceae bacterium]